MLINNTAYKEQYTANGLTVNFAITFPFFDSLHIKVFESDADSEEATLVDSTLYTITGAGSESGGTLTFATAPTSGLTIAILRDMPITQTYEYTELDNFPAKSHENALAKLTMICQEIKEETDRAIKVPATSTDPADDYALQLFAASDAAIAAAEAAEASEIAAEAALQSVTTTTTASKAEIVALKEEVLDEAEDALDDLVADAKADFTADVNTKTAAALASIDPEVIKAETAADASASSATAAASSATAAASSATAAASSASAAAGSASSANTAWDNLASATATAESVDSWQEASVTLTDGEFHFTIPRAEDGMVPVGLSIANMAIGANNGHLTFTVHQCNFDTADAHIDEYGNLILQLIDAEDI